MGIIEKRLGEKRSMVERRTTERDNIAKKKKESLTRRTPTVLNSAGTRDRQQKRRVGTVLSENKYLG